jgi:hypothetical protein
LKCIGESKPKGLRESHSLAPRGRAQAGASLVLSCGEANFKEAPANEQL